MLFGNLDINLVRNAMYLKIGHWPKVTFENMLNLTLSELLNLCTVSLKLRDAVYQSLLAGLSGQAINADTLVTAIADKPAFSEYNDREIWLIIYALTKTDFELAYKLFSDNIACLQFKENFSRKALKRDDFHASHNNLLMLMDKYNSKPSLADMMRLKSACLIEGSMLQFRINEAVNGASNEQVQHRLQNDLIREKPSGLKLAWAKFCRLCLGNSFFKQTILMNESYNILFNIIKSRPKLQLVYQTVRHISIPITESPTIEQHSDNQESALLNFAPVIQQDETPSESTESAHYNDASSEDEQSPRISL